MNSSDLALPKDDNASVSSAVTMVDSSYGSLPSTSRRGTAVPEGYHSGSPRENRHQIEGPFFYSPTLSSETYGSLPGPQADMNQVFLPPASEPEIGDSSFSYTNYPTIQGFGQLSHGVSNDLSQNWATPDVPLYNPTFNFNTMRQQQSFLPEFNFQQMLQSQRAARRPHLENLSIPGLENIRTASSVPKDQHDGRNASANDAPYTSFMMSPASSVLNASQHAPTENDFPEQRRFSELK